MSTRGFVGFVVDGTEKIAYNHSDSYPGGVGVNVLDWLRGADRARVVEAARRLRVVPEDSAPTAEDVERLRRYGNPHVGGPVNNAEINSWYQLLRETQGNPAAILDAEVIEDGSAFPRDSLFCEWGYLVDLDAGAFEVYEGFQRASHSDGRFADRKADGEYYPVRRVASWSLDALPPEADLLALERTDEDDEGDEQP